MMVNEAIVKEILSLARSVKFGELVIKIQDARIVHIEKKEKFRISAFGGKEMADPQKTGGIHDNFVPAD
jgi:hypothetical protein